MHYSLKHLSNSELNKAMLCSIILLPWAELCSKLKKAGLCYAPAILPFPVMLKVYHSVPDNELPYLTFEKCQCYASLHAPTRKAALLWDQYAEMQCCSSQGVLLGSPPNAAQSPHAWNGGLRQDQKHVLELLCRLWLVRVREERFTYSETSFAQGMENTTKWNWDISFWNYQKIFFCLKADNILQFQ